VEFTNIESTLPDQLCRGDLHGHIVRSGPT
jgi:hypothetical protein